MLLVHMVCSLLSYVAFLVAFISGVLFLIQERQLKRKHMGILFRRLPPLGVLDHVNFTALGIGFAFLSVGVACGLIGARRLLGHWLTGDPKEVLTLTLWLCYCVLWVARLRAAVRGRRVALLSMLGFSLVLFTFIGAGWLLHSWHAYV